MSDPSTPVRGRHRQTVPHSDLPRELRVCAEFADGMLRGELVPLADFTRYRMAKALREAATRLETASDELRAPRHADDATTPGIERVHAERLRHFHVGHSFSSDVGRSDELMRAAECYLLVAQSGPDAWHDPEGNYVPPGGWPWREDEWDPSDDVLRNLVTAAGLIIAAYDAAVSERTTAAG